MDHAQVHSRVEVTADEVPYFAKHIKQESLLIVLFGTPFDSFAVLCKTPN